MQPLQEGIIWNKNTLHRTRPLLQERVRTDWQISSERPAPPSLCGGFQETGFFFLSWRTIRPKVLAILYWIWLKHQMLKRVNIERMVRSNLWLLQSKTGFLTEQESQKTSWTSSLPKLGRSVEGVVMRWTRGTQWEIEYHQHHTKTEILKITIASTRYTEKTKVKSKRSL